MVFFQKNILIPNVAKKNIQILVEKKIIIWFRVFVTEYGTALTTILPILFLYLNTVIVTAGTIEP